MTKQGAPRTTKAANGSAARTRRISHAPSSTPAEASLEVTLSHDELAARAYRLFVARGGQHGDDWRDWFQAEAELRRERESGRTPLPKSENTLTHGAPRRGSGGRGRSGGREA
ncbi:MAG TPA: DUF2934 domain-containing protein [Candidatus Methylomirabilis sp.]|nr:DUF2934 domain-containing protein [Candidatus Methylomirabilis sp.]